MLTSIGRAAAARRVLALAPSKLALARITARTPVAAAPGAGAVLRAVRGFSASAWVRAPAAHASKAGTKKKAPKKLTEEEREKDKLKKLKVMALLSRPKLLPDSIWTAYAAESMASAEGATLPDKIRALGISYAGLSDAEKERLRSKAQSNQTANKKLLEKWVQSYPPEAIWMANIARRRLARLSSKTRLYLIHNDRLPKRARNAYNYFVESRFKDVASHGDRDRTAIFREVAAKWNALGEAEKKHFRDLAAAEAHKTKGQLKVLRERAKTYWTTHKGGSASLI